jgi:hypothetical protein
MDIFKNKSSYVVPSTVRAFNISRRSNFSKKGNRLHLASLPSAIEFYSKELTQFHPRKNQATAICPFHSERRPSFSINLKRGAFFCFSCGIRGGDIIDYYMKRYNVNFITACKALGAGHE